MRTVILALAVLLLVSASAASASIIIHDGQAEIVSECSSPATASVLDRDGHVWRLLETGWEREQLYDPPVPVTEIRFWGLIMFVTLDDRAYRLDGNPVLGWHELGHCPGLSALPESPGVKVFASPKTVPNPSAGSCRVTFQTAAVGPVSVHVFDASGRLVRQLHDGPLPIGEFALPWDGRDDSRQDLPSGVYMAKIQTATGISTAKITLTR